MNVRFAPEAAIQALDLDTLKVSKDSRAHAKSNVSS
jgi:hypothetical protein